MTANTKQSSKYVQQQPKQTSKLNKM